MTIELNYIRGLFIGFCFKILRFLEILGFYIKDHKDLIYTFLLILASILIPLVISFFQEVNKKNEKDFKELDLLIFKEYEFNVGETIFYFFFIIFLLFFWNNIDRNYFNFIYLSNNNLNFIYLINSFITFLIIRPFLKIIDKIRRISNFDRFLKRSKDNETLKQREKYIRSKLDIKLNDIYVWRNILRANFNNKSFFKNTINIFFNKIKNKIEKISLKDEIDDNYDLVEYVIDLLNIYDDINSNIKFFSFFRKKDSNFKSFLELYKMVYDINNKGKTQYIWIDSNLNDILITNLEALDGKGYLVGGFYSNLKKHIESNEEYEDYINELIANLLFCFFKSDSILLNRGIVKRFPYKIDVNKIDNKKHKIVLKQTLQWIIDEIQYSNEKKYDRRIDNVLNYWFPDFDIITLLDILHILFMPYGENRAKSILNGKRKFGWRPRATLYPGNGGEVNIDEKMKTKFKNTIENFKKILSDRIKRERKELNNLLDELDKIIEKNNLEDSKLFKARKYKNIVEKLINGEEK